MSDRIETEVDATMRPSTPDARPPLRAGDVTATLFNELGTIFRRIQMADAFEKKVTEAAKSPAAWLLLREELNGGKDVAP